MKDILILTWQDGFFGQARKPWDSLDTSALMRHLQQMGHAVETASLNKIGSNMPMLRDRTILYSFSQIAHRRSYLRDMMQILSRQNTLIPSLDMLLCHENKGYAAWYASSLGLFCPRTWYLADAADLDGIQVSYPIVLKSVTGTNGKGVFLCANRRELLSKIKALSGKLTWQIHLDHWRRTHLRKSRTYEGYPRFDAKRDADDWREYMRPGAAFVLQEYIPGLSCDYRVIALQDRYYVMQRLTKAGDFRASGTKKFVFDATLPEGMLDFAADVFRRFRTPYLSMDIGHSAQGFHLFEFQALHFGTGAIVRSGGYYHRQAHGWAFSAQENDLEHEMASALHRYLDTYNA